MTSTMPATRQWRLQGALVVLRLLPVFACLMIAGWAVRIRLVDAGDTVPYAFLAVEAFLLGAILLVVMLRTRVRLSPAGVEVREIRTRTYAWRDIDWIDATRGHRAVRLGFVDGSARTLPVPRRLRPAVADRAVDGTVELLRRQAHHHR